MTVLVSYLFSSIVGLFGTEVIGTTIFFVMISALLSAIVGLLIGKAL